MNQHLNYLAAQERTDDLRRSARRVGLVREARAADSPEGRDVVLARFFILVRREVARSGAGVDGRWVGIAGQGGLRHQNRAVDA